MCGSWYSRIFLLWLFFRYIDAIREFNKVLLYIWKTKQYHQKSPQFDQILKKNEQMYALLAICLCLCPQIKLIEENVNNQLREKYGEKMARMQRYDDEAYVLYDELFSYACPKFITPSAPNYDEPLVNYNQVLSICVELFSYFHIFCTIIYANWPWFYCQKDFSYKQLAAFDKGLPLFIN